MDIDTALLLVLTAAAFCWFFSIRIYEERVYLKSCREEEIDRIQRAERVTKLSGIF